MVRSTCIGIMQGRLLPSVGDRIQAFPGAGWEREFEIATDIGFDSIELTVEMASWDIHPVRTAAGRRTLRDVVAGSGVALAGLCCDIFMETPLVSDDDAVRMMADRMLAEALSCAAESGLPMVELPMLGPNAIGKAGAAAAAAFGHLLDGALRRSEGSGVDILLETDLAPDALAAFMAEHAHPRLGINYDMGNSTWFGFDPREEIAAYHRHIRNVHVKDCTRADYSVPLGTGETDLGAVFALLAQYGYAGGFILQAARGQDDDVAAARDYLTLCRTLVADPGAKSALVRTGDTA